MQCQPKGEKFMSDTEIPTVRRDDFLSVIGRNWGIVLTYGILMVILGIVILVWPDATLLVIAVLFGINLFITGIFQVVASFTRDEISGGMRALLAIVGVLGILVGIYLLKHPVLTIAAIVIVLGAFWVVNGVVDFFSGLTHPDQPYRGWRIASGVLGFIAGLIVLFWPAITALALVWVLGIWLVVYGLIAIFGSFQIRKLATAV